MLRVVTEKTESGCGIISNQLIGFLNLVVKRLDCGNYLNIWAEIDSCRVVPSFYIKMMKRRTLLACSLKHRLKKCVFSVLENLNLFKLGRR